MVVSTNKGTQIVSAGLLSMDSVVWNAHHVVVKKIVLSQSLSSKHREMLFAVQLAMRNMYFTFKRQLLHLRLRVDKEQA